MTTPTAAVPGDVGLPSEEEIRRIVCDHIWVDDDGEAATRALLSLIRPALEAKERALTTLAEEWDAHGAKLAESYYAEREKRLSAEAKLAQAVEALDDVLAANQRFRDQMPADWEGDPLQDACDRARSAARGETT